METLEKPQITGAGTAGPYRGATAEVRMSKLFLSGFKTPTESSKVICFLRFVFTCGDVFWWPFGSQRPDYQQSEAERRSLKDTLNLRVKQITHKCSTCYWWRTIGRSINIHVLEKQFHFLLPITRNVPVCKYEPISLFLSMSGALSVKLCSHSWRNLQCACNPLLYSCISCQRPARESQASTNICPKYTKKHGTAWNIN